MLLLSSGREGQGGNGSITCALVSICGGSIQFKVFKGDVLSLGIKAA